MDRIDDFLTAYSLALDEAAALHAELEAAKTALSRQYARLVIKAGGSQKMAEYAAEASEEYEQESVKLDDLRLRAGKARAKADGMTARLDVWRTRESTRRAQLQQRRDHNANAEA